jgi:hypothetical protein
MQTVEERLARLEKSHRRYRTATAGLLLALIASLSMGQITLGGGTGGMKAPFITADHFLAANSFTLNDAKGNARLVLSTDADTPILQVKDPENHTLLAINATDKAANLVIQDAAGKKLFSAP